MVPSGAMSVKRPRLPEDLTDRVDKLRGLIPFDAYVRESLYVMVHLAEGDRRLAVEALAAGVPADELLHDVFMESYGFHWPDFKAAVDREHERWLKATAEAEADA